MLALVGESGSGKSVFTKSFMGLLDANGSITGGSIDYYPTPGCVPLHLAALKTEKEWLAVRGREIAMVMQDPMTSLNPLKTIGEQITEAVKRAMNQSDVVILTGGLGPTKDDITKKTLAELFGSRLVCDQTVADHVRRMLEARGIEYNRLNRDQALVPACCTVLFNAHGTAPGMWFEQNGKVVVSLPGVPFEMEHLMTDEVMPRLKARFSLRQIVHRTLITAGLAESMLAEKIADWENALPPYLHLAYLPAPGVVRLRLSWLVPSQHPSCACRLTKSKARAYRTKSTGNSPPCNASFPATSSDSSGRPCRRSSTTC